MSTLRAVPDPTSRPERAEPLWRDVLGEHLRGLRTDQGATLQQVARRAGISMQYLSEIERGAKEPSSEMIAAVAGALGTDLAGVTGAVSRRIQAPAHESPEAGSGRGTALALAA